MRGGRDHGFTLIEVTLVVALLGLIVGLAIPFYQAFQVSNQVETTAHELGQALRRAQAQARASVAQADHGVYLNTENFTLFRNSYTPGEANNEVTDIPGTLTVTTSFGATALFRSNTGLPLQAGTITISDGGSTHALITINEHGLVEVQ